MFLNSSTLGPCKAFNLFKPIKYETTKRIKVVWFEVANLITASTSGLSKNKTCQPPFTPRNMTHKIATQLYAGFTVGNKYHSLGHFLKYIDE